MSENFSERTVKEIFEMNFSEYKLIAGHLQEAFVQHESESCDRVYISDVEDAQELFNAIVKHHEKYHEKKEKDGR